MRLSVFSSHRALLNFAKNPQIDSTKNSTNGDSAKSAINNGDSTINFAKSCDSANTDSAKKSLSNKPDSAFIPPCKTIGDFFDNAVIYNGARLNSSLRSLFLWNAIKNIEIKDLGFEKTFIRFLEHSNFIFKFFDELENANVNISDIDINDTYGDYSDHLQILERIYEAYKKELEKYGLFATNADFKINEKFLRAWSEIYIYIDGILTQREMQILRLCAKHSDITIFFSVTKYNINLLQKTLSLDLEQNAKYSLNLNKNELCKLGDLSIKVEQISVYNFEMRISQVLLVIAKINEWLKDGIENIAVILPDEEFAKYLQLFDKKRNLNYAMGFSDFAFIKKLQNLRESLKGKTPKETLDLILKDYRLENELEIIALRPILENLGSEEIIEFLLQNIANVDDNSGGKVSVMGVLESRSMEFERVIILDFNSEFIPKLNDNDMFLNTTIRKRLNLPTLQDKENLQRHYYFMLINNVKSVEIAYCKAKIPASLINDLKNMSVRFSECSGDNLWHFTPKQSEKVYVYDEIIAKNTRKILSASAIKVFLECKRKFYFKYIANLASSGEREEFLGTKIHNLLCFMGESFDIDKIPQFVESQGIGERLDLEIGLQKLEPFFKAQKAENAHIIALEKSKDFKIKGFDFTCKVDRIDSQDSKIRIIDYKYKKNFKAETEGFLQLLIYKLAFCEEFSGKEIECLYYDLYNNKTYAMDSANESKASEILNKALDELNGEVDFAYCDDKNACQYCDYKYLCNRF